MVHMRKAISVTYEDIISVDNLLAAWQEIIAGKRGRKDVQEFEQRLMEHVFALHEDLRMLTYKHGPYEAFAISDPKPRSIHKATVCDRLLHHAVYRQLYPAFDRRFIADSYSCRKGKGTHKALDRFRAFAQKVSKNRTRTVWVLQCDIRKFFASIDHSALLRTLRHSVVDSRVIWLLERIVCSFTLGRGGKGLPLGNLTSQLLVNIYMNEFDQFVKHGLKVGCYVRYADDFVILSDNRVWLTGLLPVIEKKLREDLRLELHPNKVHIKALSSGIDFLGWVHFPDHRVLRTATKRRMLRSAAGGTSLPALNSYMGMLKHGNSQKLERELEYAAQIGQCDDSDGFDGTSGN